MGVIRAREERLELGRQVCRIVQITVLAALYRETNDLAILNYIDAAEAEISIHIKRRIGLCEVAAAIHGKGARSAVAAIDKDRGH